MNALEFLKEDHQKVKRLFQEIRKNSDRSKQKEIFDKIDTQSHSQILDQIAQETYRPFGIINIARSILHPHNVSGLSQMSQDRVIRRIFTMMGVEPPKGPRHSGPVVITLPSTSTVNRPSLSLSMASQTISLLICTSA